MLFRSHRPDAPVGASELAVVATLRHLAESGAETAWLDVAPLRHVDEQLQRRATALFTAGRPVVAYFGRRYPFRDLPPARVYHAISTGYAGLMAARASIETGRPSLITEHGIYTNERRIEIALAEWLHDPGALSLGESADMGGLKSLWANAFSAYSRTAYESAHRITTLYRGNQDMQLRDGAPARRLMIVPNGVDHDCFAALPRHEGRRRPCVALIGRVVPIKDRSEEHTS